MYKVGILLLRWFYYYVKLLLFLIQNIPKRASEILSSHGRAGGGRAVKNNMKPGKDIQGMTCTQGVLTKPRTEEFEFYLHEKCGS